MPRFYRKKIEELIKFSGSKKPPQSFFNRTLFISCIIGAFFAIIFSSVMIFFIAFLCIFLLLHGFLILIVEKRTKFVEKILPDALQLMAANMRSGFIPSRAMLLSARKEFGPLSEAIKIAGKEMMTGKSLEESLTGITKNIKSEALGLTVKLIIRGIKSGGQLVSLFEETAIDMRRKESVKKDIRANILMYSIFIGFAACVGAPALYALSNYLVSTITVLGKNIHMPEQYTSTVSLFRLGSVSVSQDFLFLFSITAIAITTFFGGLIMGLIESGKEKAGIKYIPVMMAVGFAVFFLTKLAISGMFGSMMPK